MIASLTCNACFYTLHYTDIDECERQMDDCSVNANCSDTEGSFNCTCVTGYEGNGVNCTSKCKSYVVGILPNNNADNESLCRLVRRYSCIGSI